MKVITCNVLVNMHITPTKWALDKLLSKKPHILSIQEWEGKERTQLLKNRTTVIKFPRLRKFAGTAYPTTGYVSAIPARGGPPVIVDASWGEVLTCRRITLAPARKGVRATVATEALIRVRQTQKVIPVLNTHLLAHHDRPEYKAGWERGRRAAEDWAESWAGYFCLVMGDMNDHMMPLPPLVSCWTAKKPRPTFGVHRTIDHIYARIVSRTVRVFDVGSDHLAVEATY